MIRLLYSAGGASLGLLEGSDPQTISRKTRPVQVLVPTSEAKALSPLSPSLQSPHQGNVSPGMLFRAMTDVPSPDHPPRTPWARQAGRDGARKLVACVHNHMLMLTWKYWHHLVDLIWASSSRLLNPDLQNFASCTASCLALLGSLQLILSDAC